MLPHVSSLIPLSARTLSRHCAMTQVVHDDVPDLSEKDRDADDVTPRDSDAGDGEENQEGTGIRNWLKKKLKDAIGIVENTLHHAPATPSTTAGTGGNSGPVATTPTVQVVDTGAQTSGTALPQGEAVSPEQSDVHSTTAVHNTTPRRAANAAGPSGTTTRAFAGEASLNEAHMHAASPGKAHVNCSEGPGSPPKSPYYTPRHGRAGKAEDGASPSSARGAAADQERQKFVPGNGKGRKAGQGVPMPMLTGLDTDSKALCSFVAQGYQVCFMVLLSSVVWLQSVDVDVDVALCFVYLFIYLLSHFGVSLAPRKQTRESSVLTR